MGTAEEVLKEVKERLEKIRASIAFSEKKEIQTTIIDLYLKETIDMIKTQLNEPG